MDAGAAIFFTDYSIGPAALGRALEERGFGSLWAPEHSHIPLSRRSSFPQGGDLPKKYYDVMDPFVTLAAAAAVTTKLQVATGVCLVVQRDPIQTAKAVASLDQVSGGRFLFGIGAGWNAEEMADHGTDFKTRFQLMQERVEAMRELAARVMRRMGLESAMFNMELVLDRKLADRRIWPAIDITQSGTRREEKLLEPETLHAVTMLRRTLATMHHVDAMEQLATKLAKFKSNREFIKLISGAQVE